MKKAMAPPQLQGNQPHYGEQLYYDQAVAYGGLSPEDGIDLLRLLYVGVRRWKTIALVVLLFALLGGLYLKLATPIYEASVLMEMSVRKPRLVKESAVIEEQGRVDEDMVFNTRLKKFQSLALRERVLAAYCERHTITDDLFKEELLEKLKEEVTWTVQRKSYVLEISFRDADAAMAQEIANLLAGCAQQMMIDENRSSSDNAVQWLQQQAENQKKDLDRADQALIAYRSEAKLDALRSKKNAGEAALLQLNEDVVDLESQLMASRTQVEFLLDMRSNPDAAQTVPEGVVNAEQLQEFITEWWEAKVELSTLQERYTEQHPLVKEAAANLNQLRERLVGFLNSIVESSRNTVKLLDQQVKQIRERIAMQQQEVLNLEMQIIKAEGRLNTLQREREADDATYRGLLARIEESRMAADENTAVLKVVESAILPDEPVSPRMLRVLALAILLGGMVGYSVGFLLEVLEDKLTGIKDLEKMGLEMLALIPQQKVSDRTEMATICLQDKFSHLSEVFASLRTILTFQEAKEHYRVLLITSTQPEEGKTVTSSNLAITMAQSGRKTVLIDFDLRRPRLRRIYAPEQKITSLLHLLDEKRYDDFSTLPVSGGHEQLDIISSIPSDQLSPAEILGGEGPQKLIEWARANYECVIIDTPPLGIVGDSQQIAEFVDGVIIAARPEHTRKRALRHMAERMTTLNTNVIGVVLNNVVVKKLFRYSSSYHHYDSYHSYGSYKSENEA